MDKDSTTIFSHQLSNKTMCLYKTLVNKRYMDEEVVKFILRFYWRVSIDSHSFKILVKVRYVEHVKAIYSSTEAEVYEHYQLAPLSKQAEEILKSQSIILSRRLVYLLEKQHV